MSHAHGGCQSWCGCTYSKQSRAQLVFSGMIINTDTFRGVIFHETPSLTIFGDLMLQKLCTTACKQNIELLIKLEYGHVKINALSSDTIDSASLKELGFSLVVLNFKFASLNLLLSTSRFQIWEQASKVVKI
jgi:hypothetical protein